MRGRGAASLARPRGPAEAGGEGSVAIGPFTYRTAAMGGQLAIHLAGAGDSNPERAARAVAARVGCWAARLTRHGTDSDLIRLNAARTATASVRPTVAAVLAAALEASRETDGLVDVTLLDARLAAEGLGASTSSPRPGGEWSLERGRRGAASVSRAAGLHFDLDGVGKGWIADRALRRLDRWPSAAVDADGDMALRAAPGRHWEVGVDDPRVPGALLAVLTLGTAAGSAPRTWGVATSGTSVHRWEGVGGGARAAQQCAPRHHLIDPATGRPALTDVVQATVITGSALRAEALAKAAVIAGSVRGLELLERAGVRGAVVLTESGDTLALPQTVQLLAA